MRPPVEAIGALALVVGAIAFLIFIGVEGTLIYSAWRYRASRVAGAAPQIEGNRTLEIVWTAIPLVILVVVFALMTGTIREIGTSVAGGTTPAAMRILARGYQWWWEYRYPSGSGDVVTANELHIPANTAIDLDLESADVVHSFWVPAISGKTDMIPGKTNHLRLYGARTGTFYGQCAEFCGVEHAWMRIVVVVEPRADFDRWLAGQARPAATPTDPGPAPNTAPTPAGADVFARSLCVSCHTVRGVAVATGKAGPDLTHVGTRSMLGGGVLKNDPASMRAWLADPQRYKPGSLMPRVPLTDAELDALVRYLEGLK